MFTEIAKIIGREYSGAHGWDFAADVHRSDRWSTWDAYHRTADYCAGLMQEWKVAGVEKVPHPSDGYTAHGDWIIPQAWNVEEATIEVVSPAEEAFLIARYTDEPAQLIMHSGPTPEGGIDGEIVLVENEEMLERLTGKLQGKIAFFPAHFDQNRSGPAERLGAVGYLCDNTGRPHLPPGTVAWHNYDFGPRNRSGLWGFSISTEAARRLHAALQRCRGGGQKLIAHGEVRTKLGSGYLETVTGYVEGTGPQEVMTLGHIYEYGATDNASGAGMILEALRALQRLVERGDLPRPKRHIRGALVMEIAGTTAYLEGRREELPDVVAGMNLDMAGSDQEKAKSFLTLHECPESDPSAADVLAQRIMEEVVGNMDPNLRWTTAPFGVTDNIIADPMMAIPCPMMWQIPSCTHHNSGDTPPMNSPYVMGKVGLVTATYLYFLATMDVGRAGWLCEETLREGKRAVLRTLGRYTGSPDGEVDWEGLDARLQYLRGRQEARLRSIGKLAMPEDGEGLERTIEEACRSLGRFADEERRRIGPPITSGQSPLTAPDGLKERAARLVPRRLKFGTLTLETLPEEVRPTARYQPNWSAPYNLHLFWVDGKRTVLEVSELCAHEFGRDELAQLMDYFEFLHEHGYLALEAR